MASTIARAHSLAAQLSTVTGVQAEVKPGTDGVAVQVELPESVSTAHWDAVLAALLALPVSDRIGGERGTDGAVRLWAILRDNHLPLETLP